MSVHQEEGSDRVYVLYRDEARKQRKKRFGRDRAAAEAFDKHLAADRIQNIRPAPKPEPGMLLDKLAQLYLNDRRANGASKRYTDELPNLLNNHWLKVIPPKPVDNLTYKDMLKVAEYYSKNYSQPTKPPEEGQGPKPGKTKTYSQSTRNRYLGYLRAIFKFGVRHGFTKNNPLASWSKSKELPRRAQLTVEDLKKIIQHAAPHLKWGIEVEWALGTRPGESELLALKWEHCDLGKGCVSVFATKTKTWRTIPISPEFKADLKRRKDEAKTDHVIEYLGKPIRKFRNSFKTACRKAGINYPCRMYDVRHLFATVMLAGGADLAAVSKLLGHSTTQETANTYYELLKGEKEKAVSLLPSILSPEQPEATPTPEPEPHTERKQLASKVVPITRARRADVTPQMLPPSRKLNRGERIRTSDPLLPRQVR